MYNFFVSNDAKSDGFYKITGSDYNHIKSVLRMKIGEELYVSENGKTALCVISDFTENAVIVKIMKEDCSATDLPIKIVLFQALIKSDNFELALLKSVELGVDKIVPVCSLRSIIKIEDKKKAQKIERWQSISEAGAKQSKRNSIPKVDDITSFKLAIEKAKECDKIIVPYECKNGMESFKKAFSDIKRGEKIAVFIGPEGGFDESEIALIEKAGGIPVSLGKRILRAETATLTTLSALMLTAECNLVGE